MKYHSIQWWLYAILFQIKDYFINGLLRKILKIKLKKTRSRVFIDYINEHSEVIYNVLVSKYPEFKNTRKYVYFNKAYISSDLNNASTFYYLRKTVVVFWTHVATLQDIKDMIQVFMIINCDIYQKNGSKHSVNIVGYTKREKVFIVQDPLGDINTDYKIFYGNNVEISEEYLSKHHEYSISAIFSPNENDKLEYLKELFKNRNYYFLSPNDYSFFIGSNDKSRIGFGAKVVNGNMVIKNIPQYLEGKILYGIITEIEDNEIDVEEHNNNAPSTRKTRYLSQRDN